MIVLGLTGSIGMGKTTTAALFAEEGARVHDADAAVHALYARGGAAVAPIAAAFPDAVSAGEVDRWALGRLVAGDPGALRRLEAIVHPLVAAEREVFLAQARADGVAVAVLDVPLLFESGQFEGVDAVVVVSAPAEAQRERVLARPDMTPEKFADLLARQLPDAEKRGRADFVVDTGQGLDAARAQVRALLRTVIDPAWRPNRKLAAPGEPSH
jgi:dephospho-CoA kinase